MNTRFRLLALLMVLLLLSPLTACDAPLPPPPTGDAPGTSATQSPETTQTLTTQPPETAPPATVPPEPVTVVAPVVLENPSIPSNAVPDLRYWADGKATVDGPIHEDEEYSCCKYQVDDALAKQYVAMLRENGFTLVDEYEFSYKGKTFVSWGLTCDKFPKADTIKLQYEDTPCHVSIWSSKKGTYRVDISPDLKFLDTGLRWDGSVADLTPQGPSVGTGLLLMPDGSYQTTDGRLRAFTGTANVIRNGKTYTCDARHQIESGKERLWLDDYYRNEGIFVEMPESYVMEGDIFQAGDFERERYWADDKESLTHYNWGGPFFSLLYDGKWKGPTLNDSDFEVLTLRVLYYEDGGDAVYYIYARLPGCEPEEVEALCAVYTGDDDSGGFGDATRLAVGQSVTLTYTNTEFGTDYNVFEWEVIEGQGNVTIDFTGNRCTVTAADPGVAVVKVTYSYTTIEPDVLTGIDRTVHRSRSKTYNFIIE